MANIIAPTLNDYLYRDDQKYTPCVTVITAYSQSKQMVGGVLRYWQLVYINLVKHLFAFLIFSFLGCSHTIVSL